MAVLTRHSFLLFSVWSELWYSRLAVVLLLIIFYIGGLFVFFLPLVLLTEIELFEVQVSTTTKNKFYSRLSWKLNVRDVSSFHLECCRLHKDTRKSTHQVTCNISKWSPWCVEHTPCIHICTIPVKIMKSYILEDTSDHQMTELVCNFVIFFRWWWWFCNDDIDCNEDLLPWLEWCLERKYESL